MGVGWAYFDPSLETFMRTDVLLQTTADAFDWDYNELYALKYELDQHVYHYGQHYRNPRESSPERITAEKFALNHAKIRQISEALANYPSWANHAVTSHEPTIVSFNYNYANWVEALHREGFNVEPPLWHGFPTDNAVVNLLQALCALLREMMLSNFNLILSKEFRESSRTVKRILTQYYASPRFRALFIPFLSPFFEYSVSMIFRQLERPTFAFDHGIPCVFLTELADVTDYTVVWGEQVKRNYMACGGVSADRLLVAGSPTYQNYQPKPLRFDLEDVLVCGWTINGAAIGNLPCNQNRGHIFYFLNSIQSVLRKLGVNKARLRPHPCESPEWLEGFVDNSFYEFDREPLNQSLQRSSAVIGSMSTLFVEAMYYGVNYLPYVPDVFDYGMFYLDQPVFPPFDGSDPRIPIATNPETLEQIIVARKCADPSCFGNYVKTPFDPKSVTDAIARHASRLSDDRIPASDQQIVDSVKSYSMVSAARLMNVIRSVEHVEQHQIEGAFVECGVWKGGSTMAALRSFLRRGPAHREVYLYDTFDGMTAPTDVDVAAATGQSASVLLNQNAKDKESHYWAYAPLEDVRGNVFSTGYPGQLIHFVKGRVEETIPATMPEKIAILRLDTDWYESTRHELVHLYPRLVSGGVLILDDYGFWKGARKAVDEYFSLLDVQPEFRQIDDTGICCIKP